MSYTGCNETYYPKGHPMDEYVFAFEIKNHMTFRLAQQLWPHLVELTFEQVRNHFLVIDQREGTALYGPGAIMDSVDHIENGPEITLKKLFFKK